ncbi:MAG: transglutaminase-like domain-containing protein [Desulfurococcus sp.]|nr:transglutaminase-like domain-containing protein [Desulfurococcus sp.]
MYGYIDDRDAWYIWIVNVWVAKNIRYVKDPGFELFQKPSETLELKAGDCDDVAILLASMYQALGLQTKFIEVDTDGDRVIDHLAVLVRYPRSLKEFLNAEEEIAEAVGLGSRLPDIISVKYLEIKGDTWIIVDPFASESDYCVGMIKHEPYVIIHYFP